MNKIFISFLCGLLCCTMVFSQTTPFPCTTTSPSYVIGFKNGTNCTVAPFNVYTMSLTGTLSTTPLFSTPDTIEVNGIGINSVDSRGYALWFRRDNNSTPNSCINDTVKLIRFGANGAPQLLGYIPQPAGYTLNTALGTMGADGAYYYGALVNGQLAVGRIANVAALASGTSALTATYRTVVNACGGRIFADWAFMPGTNTLYTYGISANANNLAAGVVMSIDLNATTTNLVMNCVSGTETTGTFTDVAQDNLGGIIFGTDGFMYGVNVNTRRYYRINTTNGAITLVSTFPSSGTGAATTSPMRTDMGSCVMSTTPTPTPFNCSMTNASYLITYKQGTNCTKNPYGVYTFSNFQTGALNPTPLITTADTIEINAIGLSKVDNFGYGFIYRRDDNTNPGSCINDTLKFFRFGANGATQILGYVMRPASPALDLSTAVGCMNSNGTYYFSATANGQLYIAQIRRTDTLTSIPNRPVPFVYNPVNLTCFRSFADWAISPTTGQLVSYGIYVNSANQVAGTMVTIDLSTYVLSCYGMETTNEFTTAGQDNFGGIMYGTDAFMYGVNVYTKRYYKINPATGQITYISTIPASTSTIRTDFASCVTDPTILPLGFDKPVVTSLGECRAELSWNVSGVELGDAFVVEKSFDGKNFTTLTTLNAASAGLNSYDVTDGKTGITNYYRIKGVSRNGDVKYSPIVRFLSSCGGKNNVTLFQNVLAGTTMVTGEVSLYKSQAVAASIYNSTGVKVFSKTTTATAGVSRFNYDISSLSKGVYLLQTVIGEERFTEKFIVQ